MAVELDANVIGDERLRAALKRLDDATQERVVRFAANRALAPTFNATQGKVPRRTGRLASGVRLVNMSKGRGKGRIGARIILPSRKLLASWGVGFGKNGRSYYPAAQEYGWKRGGKKFPGVSYLRAPFQQRKGQTLQNFIARLWQAVSRAWRKGGLGDARGG